MGLNYPLEGGCSCGQLRYRDNALPLVAMACHCSLCKRRTGGAFSLSMLTMRADFEIVGGRTISAEAVGGSGAPQRHHVCPHCFVRVYSEMLAYPDILNLRAGTLDDPEAVAPAAQIWTSAALPWALSPTLKSYTENPTDMPALIAEWRAAHA